MTMYEAIKEFMELGEWENAYRMVEKVGKSITSPHLEDIDLFMEYAEEILI